MTTQPPRGAGFTLIELMAVALIIGILASAALPNYSKAIDTVREAEAVSNLSAALMAQHVYFMENNLFAENSKDLLINIPPLHDWSLPGVAPNFIWTTTSHTVEIVATSKHGHPNPADHLVRARIDSDGKWIIEHKRLGDIDFSKIN